MRKLPKVAAENYFSPEVQAAYMSVSQFKAFQRCEAAALAELRGDYIRPTSAALLFGSYVDAYFSGEMDGFRAEHPEDRLFSLLLSGRKQVIHTGEIAGVPFKIKVDSLLGRNEVAQILSDFPDTASVFGFGDGALVDLKVMRDMEPVWSGAERAAKPVSDWAKTELAAAVAAGITDGQRPRSYVTREEAAIMVQRKK